jgi:hypothetical protein
MLRTSVVHNTFGHEFGGSAKHATACLLPMLVGMCAVHQLYMQLNAVYVVCAVCMVAFACLLVHTCYQYVYML